MSVKSKGLVSIIMTIDWLIAYFLVETKKEEKFKSELR